MNMKMDLDRRVVWGIIPIIAMIFILPEVLYATGDVCARNDNYYWGPSDTRICWQAQWIANEGNLMVAIVKADRSRYTSFGPKSGFQFYAKAGYPAAHRAACQAYQNTLSCYEENWIICQVILTEGEYGVGFFNENPNASWNDFINKVRSDDPKGQGKSYKNGKFKKADGTDVETQPGQPDSPDNSKATSQSAKDIADNTKAASQSAKDIEDELKRPYDPTTHPAEMPRSIPEVDTTKLNYITLLRNLTQGNENFSWVIDWNIQNPMTGTIYRNIHVQVYPLENETEPIMEMRMVFRAFMNVLYTILLGSAIYRLIRQV